jgi:RHS repeat-associated protein
MIAGGKKQYYLDLETALYLLGSGMNGRYYDPATARFMSENPQRHRAGDPNLFAYVQNDPIDRLDPSGHDSQEDHDKQAKEEQARQASAAEAQRRSAAQVQQPQSPRAPTVKLSDLTARSDSRWAEIRGVILGREGQSSQTGPGASESAARPRQALESESIRRLQGQMTQLQAQLRNATGRTPQELDANMTRIRSQIGDVEGQIRSVQEGTQADRQDRQTGPATDESRSTVQRGAVPGGLAALGGLAVLQDAARGAQTDWHHLLSKSVFDPANKESALSKAGLKLDPSVDIHSGKYGWETPGPEHARLHSNNNPVGERWEAFERDWLEKQAGKGAFKDGVVKESQIRALVAKVKRDFGLVKDGKASIGRQAEREFPGVVGYLKGLGDKLVKSEVRIPGGLSRLGKTIGGMRPGFVTPQLLGKLAMGVGAALDLDEIRKSDHPVQTALEKGGAWGAMLGGAELGGMIGGPIGAFVGGAVGYVGGEKAVQEVVPIAKLAEQTKDIRDFNQKNDMHNPFDDPRSQIMSPAAQWVEPFMLKSHYDTIMDPSLMQLDPNFRFEPSNRQNPGE